jgi:hypothetical protein
MTPAHQTFADWLKTRPESVQRLAAEFPIGLAFRLNDTTLYLLGYTEEDMLIVSQINPSVDYDGANRTREYLCAEHARPWLATVQPVGVPDRPIKPKPVPIADILEVREMARRHSEPID